jgi:hypothetical protein
MLKRKYTFPCFQRGSLVILITIREFNNKTNLYVFPSDSFVFVRRISLLCRINYWVSIIHFVESRFSNAGLNAGLYKKPRPQFRLLIIGTAFRWVWFTPIETIVIWTTAFRGKNNLFPNPRPVGILGDSEDYNIFQLDTTATASLRRLSFWQ